MTSIKLNDIAPDFTAQTTRGELSLHDYLGDSWGILFSHPKTFTPVCTTELGEVSRLKPEFDKRNIKILGLSVDTTEDQKTWEQDIKDTQGHEVNFPMVSDSDRKIADLYGMIHPNADNTLTVRTVFVIDANKKVRLTLTYPASTGRDFGEILRAIDSMQLTDKHKVATPVNWRDGEDVIIIPAVDNEQAKKLFPDGWEAPKPYLRIVKQPR